MHNFDGTPDADGGISVAYFRAFGLFWQCGKFDESVSPLWMNN